MSRKFSFRKQVDTESACSNLEKSSLEETLNLSPKEAFERFDADSSGAIEEDEFFHLLECVGIKADCEYQERIFYKYATLETGGLYSIGYERFKKAWLLVSNPKKELLERGVKNLPKFATRYQLVGILEKVLDEEERLEALTKAEADRWNKLQENTNLRTEYIRKAKARAGLELSAALDAAGQIYVLGKGSYEQFAGKPKKEMRTSSFQQVGFELIQSLWDDRVQVSANGKKERNLANCNTAGVWGRQPRKVAFTDDTIFALTDSGILAWGGTNRWHEVSNNDTNGVQSQTTPRSSALLMNDDKTHQKHLDIIQEEIDENETKKAIEVETLKRVLDYYGELSFQLENCRDPTVFRKHLSEKVSYDQLIHSLLIRGKPCDGHGFSIDSLSDFLSEDIQLEKEILGEEGHQSLCDLEAEVVDLKKRGKIKASKALFLQFGEKWSIVRENKQQRAEIAKQKNEQKIKEEKEKLEVEYRRWNAHRSEMKGSSVDLKAMSITARGGEMRTPRGNTSHIQHVAGGGSHAAIIIEGGQLYMWGVASTGRLGLRQNQTADSNRPKFVDEFKGTSIIDVGCGKSHTAAVASDGGLFLWGASSCGQLGFGEFPDGEEFYCPTPTRLIISSCSVRRVSCGSNHTACLGASGEMYIWGCGNGGRLGLGSDCMKTVTTPKLVESLRHENIVDVSCGCYQTLASTSIEKIGKNCTNGVKTLEGGKVYGAGSKLTLGRDYPIFDQILSLQGIIVKSISAGFSHQAVVSEGGELYCWGSNINGCCGQEESTKFVAEPTKIDWIYELPLNLALRQRTWQSSFYNDSEGLTSGNGVDGNVDGTRALVHTQFEANPYWICDLGAQSKIKYIRLWNRTDEPDDMAMETDMFTKRLFPCWIMVSQFPFPEGLEGKEGLDASLRQSIARFLVCDNKRLNQWRLPSYTIGRFVKVQLLESNFLHFAQVEVYGHANTSQGSYGPVSSCAAGKYVTAAVVEKINDTEGIEMAFQRAGKADWFNAQVLRNFESYADEFDKHTFNNLHDNINCSKCLLCIGNQPCDICTLKRKFHIEFSEFIDKKVPYRLDDVCTSIINRSENATDDTESNNVK